MAEIERTLVKKSFGSHASQYDSLAKVQKIVTDRFIERLANKITPPASLLDIGAGTGRLLEKISLMFPETDLVGIDLAFEMTKVARDRLKQSKRTTLSCSDAENLPFRNGTFDIVVSTSTYQWVSPIEEAFAEAYRVLKPAGRFCFALFGEKTLFELKDSYMNAAIGSGRPVTNRTHQFASAGAILSAMTAAGFTGCDVNEEMEIEIHPDATALLRALKGIGAGSAALNGNSGLSGRSAMLRMMEIYREKYGVNGGVQATYHILYGFGAKL